MSIVKNSLVNFAKYSIKPNVYSATEHIPITQSDAVSTATELLNFGSVIVIPTDTVYGLACDATNIQAIHKLYSIKCRDENKPVAICLDEIQEIKCLAHTKHLPNALLNYLLPGPVTLILNSINKLNKSLCHKGKVGIRIPDYNFIRELTTCLGKPLALTSANLSNEPSAVSTFELQRIGNQISAIFDGGVVHTNRSGSTIIDLSAPGTYQIIREGIAYKETANYSRHLEEIAKEAERQTLASVQNLLMEERVNKAVQLLEYWEEYLVVSDAITQTMDEEVQLFLRRITKLESLLKELYMKCSSTDEGNTILQLLNKCSKIFENVNIEKSLSAGGRFEWVNSVLVKCLQEGAWLLVDNVNLCSAAVLDRLNALLEPNGVLTISEKGVDESGVMFEVRPHQDFRIFLTMDPKNGEISRAMKNRGVEIYMLNETETEPSNPFDLKSLIDIKGLSNPKHINGLIRIHEFISGLILSEKPRNMEILQCSSLISQQIHHGINILEAFYNTCVEVYYKTRSSSEFNCNNVLEVIKDGIIRCLNEGGGIEDYYSKGVTLNFKDLGRWSDFEKVKHQSAIYKEAISNFMADVQAARKTISSNSIDQAEAEYKGGTTSRKDKSRNINDITIWSDLKSVKKQNDFFEEINFYTLTNLLASNYTISSNEDLELRTLYLKSFISQQEWQSALERFTRVAKFFDRKDTTLPFDCRWVNETLRNDADNMACNAFNYALQVEIHKLKDVFEIKYAPKNSLYHYILALKKKSVSDIFNSPICSNYLNIRNEHFVFMRQIFINFAKKPDVEDCFIQVLVLLSWRQALHSFLTSVRLPDDRLKSPRLIISKLEALAIYYKWFYKHSVEGVATFLDAQVSSTLKKMLDNVNRQTEEQFSSSYKIAKNYKKLNSVPESFKHEWQLSAIDFLNKYDLLDSRTDTKKMLALFKNNPEFRKLLIKLKYETYTENDSNDEIALLKAFDENKTDEKSLKVHELQVLPLVDILTQMLLLYTTASISSETNFDMDFVNNNILVPVEFSGVLLKYKETGNSTLLHEIRKWFYLFGMNSASACPNMFTNEKDEGKICLLVAGIAPLFSDIMTQLLVSMDKNSTTLTNFRCVQNQQRTLSLLLWSNINALSTRKFDFMYLQKNILETHVKTFIRRLQEVLNIKFYNLDDLTFDPQNLNNIGDEKLVKSVSEILKKYTYLKKSLDQVANKDVSLSYIGDLHMLLGFTEVYLNSLLPQVDPLAKKAMKINHVTSVIAMFEQMKKSFELQNSLYSNAECPHPYYKAIKNTIFTLQDKIRGYGKSTSVGLNTHSYSFVVQQIKHAFNSALNTTILLDINDCTERLMNLTSAISTDINTDIAKIKSYIERFESNIPSFERISHDWKLYRSSYPDIVEPLLANISQFLYGLKLKLFWIKREFLKWQHRTQFNVDLEAELINFVTLPTLNENVDSLDKHVDNYTEIKMRRFMNHILNDEHKAQENLRLLKCGIQEHYNQCIVNAKNTGILDRNLLEKFNSLVEVFIDLWNTQQEKREIEKNEADSLYKTRTKCDDKSEEEQQQEELKDLFPNYHVLDFSDFQEKSLSDSAVQVSKHENSIDVITDEDLRFIIDLNTNLFKNFIKTEWLAPEFSKNVLPDFVSPLMEKFKLVRLVMDNHAHYFKYTMDSELSASLAVLLEVSRRYGAVHELGEASSPTRMINKKSKNFYKNSDVEEVKTCYHVLEELKLKVNELLQAWPDQPTLNTILAVIDKILSFDITSPVSRFLTGFDILLAKCHEWEEVAHHGVSLIEITPNLTAQIITWRKLELSGWKDLLNSTFDDEKKPLTKWWLYMYNLMNQYIREKKVTEVELIDILQKFMTKSTIVEFHGRLEIILEFHGRAVTLCKTPESQSFLNILWNIFNYFRQFSLTVSSKIKDLRTPIEKKLKDYVKIVKWKDISYWSIRDTVDKSHKTLHKFIREYKEVLIQPVTPYLLNPVTDNPVESVGIWDRPQRQNPKAYHYTLDADSYIVKASAKDLPYLSKARKICKETILGTDYPDLVKSMDSFVTDVIETSSHLRNLEVDTTLTKEKQKSQAKNILQQKHRALADLFQNLSKMGLSYKTGIMDAKLKKLTDEYTIKPIDLSVNLNSLGHSRIDEKILTIWDSCESYYYRCLMRLDVLETALLLPAKDLGMQNIDRCRGFAAHLLNFCQEQKKDLIEASRSHYYLRIYLRQIRETCDNSFFISSTTLSKIKDVLNSLTVSVCQIRIILNSCPEEQTFDDQLTEIPLLEPESNKLKFKHDETWRQAMEYVGNITSLVAKITHSFEKSETHSSCAENDLVTVSFLPFNNTEQLFNDLQKLVKTVHNLKLIFEPIKIAECLDWLSNRLEQIIEENTQESSTEVPYSSDNFDLLLDQFTKAMLLVFQNLFKKYRDASVAKQQEKTEEEEIGIQENHLKTLVMQNLSSDIAALEFKKLLNLAKQVVNELIGSYAYPSEDMRNAMMQSLPLFEQVVQLSQYFITQQVAAYRITCKLTSILLNIFIDLASKGFCIPPEFSDEIDKEGMSKPSDGMGLGEGQGERDVSDKIESEDQLDDAQPSGQEKENTEDPDCKEEDKGIEMSEDFDSKLQDKKPKDGDEDEEESNNSDAEEQLGETEKGADQLDQEIWGDDKEEVDEGEEDSEQKEDEGQGGEKEGEDQLGAKEENASKDKSKNKDPQEGQSEDSEKNKKEINEMNEPEYDDEQTDPYHGNQPELPEPEAMDLPDDLQLDEGEEKDTEQSEENPFDIDEMKDQQIPEDKPDNIDEQTKEDRQNDEEKDFSSDDEDVTKKDDDDLDDDSVEPNEDKTSEQEKVEEPKESQEGEEGDEKPADAEESALDQNPTNQESVEAMEIDDAEATDKTQASQSENLKSEVPIEETCQEDKPDKDGLGQSQMEESESGHSIQSSAPQEAKSSKLQQEKEQKRKERPGESDSKRSLGNVNQEVQKKLKTVEAKDTKRPEQEDPKDQTEEIFQHIKEATEETTTQILDAATKEQAEEQNKETLHKDDEDKEDIEAEGSKDLPEDKEEQMDVDVADAENQTSIKNDSSKEKAKSKKQHPEGDIMEDIQEVEIEGEIVKTTTVPRGGESFHHTQYQLLQDTTAAALTQEEIHTVRSEVEKQLSSWKTAPTSVEAELAWQKISSVTSSLAQDLSEQLRLVLEPTQASHLKGDFRTGRRINMRKVIPYIASQFRKDKIWLRRTKPSKREYHIVLAIDDSSSMADNHSKELAFESVALVSKALSLLESGQLAVVSFGETTEVHHKLTDPFTDQSGVQLLQNFQFVQQKTCIGKLVDFVTEMFDQSHIHASIPNAKLLLVVSDGRGVFSEGKTYVTQAVRRAKLANIFIVFVIIDSPENKNSVLDIRSTIFKDGKFLGMQNYMDEFPFSFYIILRDINSLPGVLSDALMQWFEMVTSQQ